MNCLRCQNEIPTGASSCSACGFSFDEATQKLESPQTPSAKSKPKSYSSLDSIDDSRFVPGTMLAERYRIVGLLGKGGMGEVYRADDLKLGQPVALKFLPEHLLDDGAALARFHREVRVARQVSHRNVCRVYDIGETDGRHFLSMEFIKGEELSSLIRRIGRLPQDKAVQIARQICAGLAAAHDVGFLHRDLKPANVMIDEHGNARITDFGLAGLAEEFHEDEKHAGTPAYMAPEQLDGETFTVRSDIYSLGLVLYELFTGRRAFEATTLGDLVRLRRSDTSPTTPSEIVKDLDPAIERIIDRCLEKNPAQRPGSALQVAAALPGGDPIAVALAAGETPSPEMVAAAPKEGALHPRTALIILGSVLVGLGLILFLSHRVQLYGYVPLDKSPEVLRENARDIIQKTGVSAPATDHMHWLSTDLAPLTYIARTDAQPDRRQDLKDGQPAVIIYSYRQSPAYLAGWDEFRDSWTNPAPMVSGMAGVKLDTRGRLLEFYAVPPQVDPVATVSSSEFRVSSSDQVSSPKSQVSSFDWSVLFRDAGLDIATFKRADSQWASPYVSDERLAWEGVYPEQPQIPIRVEAASYRGKPVYFQIVNPWNRPEREQPSALPRAMQALFTLLLVVFIVVLIGSVLLAIRNLRLGRGDRKGALRLAIFVAVLTTVNRLATAHHVPTFDEFGTILNGLQDAVFVAAFFWVVYIALEPFVRRRWPHRIISWSRLLAGDFRDPLVARDLLLGAIFGFGIVLWQVSVFLVRGWLQDEPASQNLGIGQFVPALVGQITTPLLHGFQILFLVILLAMLFRRDWLGFVAVWMIQTAFIAFVQGGAPINWVVAGVSAALTTLVLYRYGLLALFSTSFFIHMYIFFPVTTNITSWYALGFLLDLVIVLVVIGYTFYSSLAGQRVFGARLLDEG
jgi:serine/threonine-protein kinase